MSTLILFLTKVELPVMIDGTSLIELQGLSVFAATCGKILVNAKQIGKMFFDDCVIQKYIYFHIL